MRGSTPRLVRRMLLAAALGAAAAGSGAAPGSAAQASAGTTVLVQPGTVSPGDKVLVSGDGLPPGVPVNIQVCGNNGVGGSGECDLVDSTVAGTDEVGHFAQFLVVNVPPAPCPCVVQVVSPSLEGPIQGPVIIRGAAVGPVVQPLVPSANTGLEVISARVQGSASWAEWFGAGPTRTLVVTVENRSAQPMVLPELVLTAGYFATGGSGASPGAGFGSLSPGQRRSIRVRVDDRPLSVGTLSVAGYFVGDRQTTDFAAPYTSVPWGLALFPVLAVLLAAVLIDRWFRRRRAALVTRERMDAFVLSAMAARVRRLRPRPVPVLPPISVPTVDRSEPLQTTVEEVRRSASGIAELKSEARWSRLGEGVSGPSGSPGPVPHAPPGAAGAPLGPGDGTAGGPADTFFAAAAPSRAAGRTPGRRRGRGRPIG